MFSTNSFINQLEMLFIVFIFVFLDAVYEFVFFISPFLNLLWTVLSLKAYKFFNELIDYT